MMLQWCRKRRSGFTRTELFVVIGVVGVITLLLAGYLIPAMRKAKGGPGPPSCINNLKEVDMSFQFWADDHNNKFPMQVSTNDGGALEFMSGPNFFMAFSVMSNELSTTKVLVCPEDKEKTIATNFADFNRNHLSYFVGIDATPALSNAFLCGDRNLTNGMPLRNGILDAVGNPPPVWTGEMHRFSGNVAFVYGYTWQIGNLDLRAAIQKAGMATNRLAVP